MQGEQGTVVKAEVRAVNPSNGTNEKLDLPDGHRIIGETPGGCDFLTATMQKQGSRRVYATFHVGGVTRGDAKVRVKLRSGDVLMLEGESRLAFHGIDRVFPGTSLLLKAGGRINLTLRRVTQPG